MKMKPAPDEWVKAFDKALPDDVERRKMFGYNAAFVNGNMAAGLHEAGLVLRLPDAQRGELLAAGGKPFEPMKGRVMRGFVVAPNSLLDVKKLKPWLKRSIEHARSMPAKKKK